MSMRSRSSSLQALAVSLLGPVVAHGSSITFSDTEFADVDWSAVEIIDTTPNDSYVFTASHGAGGGNPGAYRAVTNQLSTPIASSIASGHLLQGGTFDPGEEGTFLSLDASLDGISAVGNPAGAMGYGVLIEQGGKYFAGPLTPGSVLNGAGWHTLTASGLVEASFLSIDGVSVLDLSDAGSVVTVGFYVSNGTYGTPSVNVGGVDNWSVTIHATTPTGVDPTPSESAAPPFLVGNPTPNPSRGDLALYFDLPSGKRMRIDVVDIHGRRVGQLLDADLPAGKHTIRWDGRNASGRQVSNGVYFVLFDAGGGRVARRALVAR